MTKTRLLDLLDATIAKLERDRGERFSGMTGGSGPLPICNHMVLTPMPNDGICDLCPAHGCLGWDSQDEEILYFCLIRAMVETGDAP